MALKRKILPVFSAFVCTAFAFYLLAFVHSRNTAASRAAIHNLQEIDKANQQWAAESPKVVDGTTTNSKPVPQ